MTITQVVARRSAPRRPVWDEQPSALGSAGKALVLGAVVVGVLLPLWTVVVTSLSSQETITAAGGLVLVPREITFRAYEQILAGGVVTRAVGVSAFVTIVGTLISVSVTVLGAYALSKPSMIFHRTLLFLVLITMFFGAGIIPTYLLVSGLGLINSLWALILPTAVSAFNLLIMRNFFMGIHNAILDAARIDGANTWRILWLIVVPLSRPIIATLGIVTLVTHWNNFMWPLIITTGPDWQVITVATASLQSQYNGNWTLVMAATTVAIAPLLILFAIFQRSIVDSISLTGFK